MNFYSQQHPFYCGIDLHANQMYACIVDQAGKKHLHRNYKTSQADKFFGDLEPFGKDLVLGCESTFNWYWLADACTEKQIPFVLGHALYLKAIHGGKVKTHLLCDRSRSAPRRKNLLKLMNQRVNHSSGGTYLPLAPSHSTDDESSQRWNIFQLVTAAESTSESKNQVNLVKPLKLLPLSSPRAS